MKGRLDCILRVTRTAGRLCLWPFFRLRIQGIEHLPINEAFVLLPKHQRWEDIPILGLSTPRPLYYVAKHELFKNPVTSWFLRSLGGIPLNRKRPLESRRYLKEMIEFLERGEGVVVFPEGTYYRGRMGPANIGVARLILSRLYLPFIPVGIKYERKGRRWQVNVNFGRPRYPDSGSSTREFIGFMMHEIARLSSLEFKEYGLYVRS